jgi:hypothetical protein
MPVSDYWHCYANPCTPACHIDELEPFKFLMWAGSVVAIPSVFTANPAYGARGTISVLGYFLGTRLTEIDPGRAMLAFYMGGINPGSGFMRNIGWGGANNAMLEMVASWFNGKSSSVDEVYWTIVTGMAAGAFGSAAEVGLEAAGVRIPDNISQRFLGGLAASELVGTFVGDMGSDQFIQGGQPVTNVPKGSNMLQPNNPASLGSWSGNQQYGPSEVFPWLQ